MRLTLPTTAADWHRALVEPPPPLSRRAAGWWVLGLTALAGVLRFAWLSRPCLWGDEALVYWRTCGTYADLLVPLHNDGFPPLHYELVWRIGHGFDVGLRVPWTGPVLAALACLASCAAAFAWRGFETPAGDVRMLGGVSTGHEPVPRWAWVTVATAAAVAVGWCCFRPGTLHWVRLGHLRYPGVPLSPWVLRLLPAVNGTLLVPAVYAVAVQLVPRRPAVLAAAFAACSGFTLIYSRDAKMYMNCWTPAAFGMAGFLWWLRTGRATAWLCWVAGSATAAGFHASGLIPVGVSLLFLFTQQKLRLRQAALWLLGAAVIGSGVGGYYLTFNRWVDRVEADGWRDSGLAWIAWYNAGRTDGELAQFAGTTFLTGWEWPRAGVATDLKAAHPARVYGPEIAVVTLGVALAAGLLPWPRRWQGWGATEPGRAGPGRPPWQVGLWLGLWVAVPVYAFYCRSGGDFAPPTVWSRDAWAAATRLDLHGWDWSVPDWPWLAVSLAGVLLGARATRDRGARAVFALVLVAAYTSVAAAAIERHTTWWRFGGIAVLTPGLWIASGRRFAGWTAAVVVAWVWTLTGTAVAGTLALVYWAALDVRSAKRVVVAAAVVAGVWVTCGGVYLGMAAASAEATAAGRAWQSVWVPRYMGVVWPAMCVGVVAIVTRLPTRPVRWGVAGLLLGANLVVGTVRVFGQTEPPIDRMAADAFAGQTSPATTVAWFDIGDESPFPGGGNIFSEPGAYYLQLLRGGPTSPTEFKAYHATLKRVVDHGQVDAGRLRAEVAGRPGVRRVIVWQQAGSNVPRVPRPGRPPAGGWTDGVGPAAAVAEKLPGRWRLVHENWYTVRDEWVWRDVARYCRREFERVDGR